MCNSQARAVAADETESLKALIEDKAVLNVQGRFRSSERSFSLRIEEERHEVSLRNPKIIGLWVWRKRFGKALSNVEAQMSMPFAADTEYACGDFAFQFYVFDFARSIDGRYRLSQLEKDRLKEHRIYLYRDDMRVYPYGDPEDDWLTST